MFLFTKMDFFNVAFSHSILTVLYYCVHSETTSIIDFYRSYYILIPINTLKYTGITYIQVSRMATYLAKKEW
jgi:hypothetical protein